MSCFDNIKQKSVAGHNNPDPKEARYDRRNFQTAVISETSLIALFPDGHNGRQTFDAANLGANNSLFRVTAKPLPELIKKNRPASASAASTAAPSPTFGGGYNQDERPDNAIIPPGPDIGDKVQIIAFADNHNGHVGDRGRMANKEAGEFPFTVRSDSGECLRYRAGSVKKLEKKAVIYYQALLKAERKRVEEKKKQDYDDWILTAQTRAKYALKRVIESEKPPKSESGSSDEGDSDKEEDESEEEDEEELERANGPLIAYDGIMKIEIEIAIGRAPGEKEKSEDSDFNAGQSESTDEGSDDNKSEESEPRMDIADELQALLEEIGEDEESSDGSDGLPEGLTLDSGLDNIYSASDPRLALGVAGTVFFVPDVERYALCPSLPPPPPASMLGRRRIRMKPRLPLDISNHRYRDEHPNVWAPGAWSPEIEDRQRFEETLCVHDFYACATVAMNDLPKQTKVSQTRFVKKKFGQLIENNIGKSLAWRTRLKREYLIRKDEERKAEEEAEAAALAAENAKDGDVKAMEGVEGVMKKGGAMPRKEDDSDDEY